MGIGPISFGHFHHELCEPPIIFLEPGPAPHCGEPSHFLESGYAISEICSQIVGMNLVANILRRAARFVFVSVRSWKELRYQGGAAGSEEHTGR